MNNKKTMQIISRVVAALLLIMVAVLVIYLASSRNLPFLSDSEREYSTYVPDESSEQSGFESSVPSGETSSPGEQSQTPEPDFGSYIALFDTPANVIVSRKPFDRETDRIVLLDTSKLGITDGITLGTRMGYITVSGDGGTKYFSPSGMNDITSILGSLTFTGQRDSSGNPVFASENGKYYYCDSNLVLQQTDYDPKADARGFDFEYPYYLGVQNEKIYRYMSGKYYGFRNSSRVLISAAFREAFAFGDEGVVCTIRNRNGSDMLFFYTQSSQTVSRDYYPPENRDLFSIGYFYFDNGYTRVRASDKAGGYTECLMDYTGALASLPADFKLRAYSDSVLLLEKDGMFGYMSSELYWITNPGFTDANPFIEGLAVVQSKNGKYGVIDKSGSYVIPAIFDSITNASDGVLVAYEQNNGYYIFAKETK